MTTKTLFRKPCPPGERTSPRHTLDDLVHNLLVIYQKRRLARAMFGPAAPILAELEAAVARINREIEALEVEQEAA